MNQISKKLLELIDNEYMRKYLDICDFYKQKPPTGPKFQFHHVYPVFLYRIEKNAKNRSKVIEEFDKIYDPKDNVVALPPKWHLIAHWFLGMALQTKEAVNSFQIFLKDYYTPIESYDIEKVKWFGEQYEELCLPNKLKTYKGE